MPDIQRLKNASYDRQILCDISMIFSLGNTFYGIPYLLCMMLHLNKIVLYILYLCVYVIRALIPVYVFRCDEKKNDRSLFVYVVSMPLDIFGAKAFHLSWIPNSLASQTAFYPCCKA